MIPFASFFLLLLLVFFLFQIDTPSYNPCVFLVKPLVVQILTKEPRLSADKKYEVECRSTGSRPMAVITWWIANRQIKKAKNVS